MKKYDRILLFVLALFLAFTVMFTDKAFGQIGSTDTPFSTDGWEDPVDSTQYYKLFIYRLLSNPGGWINWQTQKIDSLLEALTVYTDTLELYIENDTLKINPAFLANALANLDSLDYLSFRPLNTTTLPPPSHLEGRFYYDSTAHAFVGMLDEPDVTQQLGQEMYIRVYNPSVSVTIEDGEAVRPIGATLEGVGHIALAQADSDATSNVFGIATHSIEPETYGYVTRFGAVHSLNTLSLSPLGSTIYLSESTAGAFTTTKPSAPNNAIPLGGLTRIDNDSGSVFILMERFDPINGEAEIGFTDSAVIITVSTIDTNYRITNAWNNLFIFNTEVGHDITLSGDTLYLAEAGVYEVIMSYSFEGTNASIYRFRNKQNGLFVPNSSVRRKTTSADVGSVSFSQKIRVADNTPLTFWFQNKGTTGALTIVDATIIVRQVR